MGGLGDEAAGRKDGGALTLHTGKMGGLGDEAVGRQDAGALALLHTGKMGGLGDEAAGRQDAGAPTLTHTPDRWRGSEMKPRAGRMPALRH